MSRSRSLFLVMLVSFFFAYALSILPIADQWRGLRPNFVVLVLVFWLLHKPEWFGVLAAWSLGFMHDALLGGYLGPHALSYSVVAYIVLVLYQRLRMFTVLQQSLLVFVLLGLDLMINSWVDMVLRGGQENLYLLSNAFIGACFWPWLAIYLERLQMRMR